MMNLRTAARIFEVHEDEVTEDRVREKFKSLLHEMHPDMVEGSNPMAPAFIKKVKEARDLLMANIKHRSQLVDCKKCEGSGMMKMRRGGLIKCTTCHGEGEYIPRTFKRG